MAPLREKTRRKSECPSYRIKILKTGKIAQMNKKLAEQYVLVFLYNFKQLPFGFPQTEISNFYFGD